MKLLLFSLFAALLSVAPARAALITLDAAWTMTAGASWTLTVRVKDVAVGSAADATLINGLRRDDERLILGTGGIASWEFPAGSIIATGDSWIIVRAGADHVRHRLTVLSAPVETVEALTTANNLPAYGDASGIVIALAHDRWGNPVQDWISAAVSVDYAGADTAAIPLRYASGLFWSWLTSSGSPGRLRATFTVDGISDTLEIRQVSGSPANIRLSASIECLENVDGRDLITLTARVTDARRNPVTDGTIITFSWNDGNGGSASVLNGQAVLEVPAQAAIYEATTASARSNRVRIEVCE